MNKITIIYGPTASGKTQLACTLALRRNALLISFDSRHVYKDMSLVTGKDLPNLPTEKLFGFDLVSPNEDWSTYHFYQYVQKVLSQNAEQKKPVIFFGGSWPYVEVLFHPPKTLNAPNNPELRAHLEQLSLSQLQEETKRKNPDRWQTLTQADRSNPRRLIRSLEVASLPSWEPLPPLFEDLTIHLLEPSLETVEKNIRARVESRWEDGALEETRSLIKDYLDWSYPAFSSTGYRHLRDHLEGKTTEQEAKQLWITQERQYAKKQITWLKKIKQTYGSNLRSVPESSRSLHKLATS